jgi:hypothetical protein
VDEYLPESDEILLLPVPVESEQSEIENLKESDRKGFYEVETSEGTIVVHKSRLGGKPVPETERLKDYYYCPKCPMYYKSKNQLHRHKKLECGQKYPRFQCAYCGTKFYNKKSCSEHIFKKHRNVNKYFCNQCNAGFDYSGSLWRHREECHKKD